MKMPQGKDIFYCLAMSLLLGVFIGSAGILARNYIQNRCHDQDLEQLASLFPAETMTTGLVVAETGTEPLLWKEHWTAVADGRFLIYQQLWEQNADFVGWVRIEGTRIDYPVVQTPDNPNYYLHRDFEKKSSRYGIPYMMESCRLEEPRTSYLISAHHMRNGSMFAALHNYTDYDYYLQHPYIQFDTLNQSGSYEIAAVVKIDNSADPVFWQKVLFPSDKTEFDSGWKQFQEESFYNTGVLLTADDHLLALVTCEYTLKDGRLMVLAREIS